MDVIQACKRTESIRGFVFGGNAAAFQQQSGDGAVSSGFRGTQIFHDLLHQSRDILAEYRKAGRKLSAQ